MGIFLGKVEVAIYSKQQEMYGKKERERDTVFIPGHCRGSSTVCMKGAVGQENLG